MRARTPLALALVVLGCASSGAGNAARETQPFPQSLARFFDDGVDYVENVESLGGRVAADWRRQIDTLTRESELIVPVRVETVTSGADATSMGSYRLTAVASGQPLRGDRPEGGRVELRVVEGEPGFNSVRSNVPRLQAREYVLFARWYTDEDGAVRAHWHLTPRTEGVLQRVRDAVGYIDPNAPRQTVIRTN